MSATNQVEQLPVAEAMKPTPQKLLSLGVLSPELVDRICADETKTHFLVEDFLPAKGVGIIAGDSAIGKSPLACQLALSVAAGVPFLGMTTKQTPVLYLDLENPLQDCKAMRDSLVRFNRLTEAPEDFLLVTEPRDLEPLLAEVRPGLVVIDSLRAFRPDVTERTALRVSGSKKFADWLARTAALF